MKKKALLFTCVIIVLFSISALLLYQDHADSYTTAEKEIPLSEPNQIDESGECSDSHSPATIPSPEPDPVASNEPSSEKESPEGESAEEAVTEDSPILLHSGLRDDGSFDSGTIFIGDSLTYTMVKHYLEPLGYMGNAKSICRIGAAVTAFFSDIRLHNDSGQICIYPEGCEYMTYPEAVAALGEDVTAIYFMMGTNISPYVDSNSYIEIVDYLLETCPNSTIHLQTVPYSWSIPYEDVNDNVLTAYAHYQEMEEMRVILFDTCAAIGENLIRDGVHMNDIGRDNWYKAIIAHAQEYNLPQ